MGTKVEELRATLYRVAKTEPTRRFHALYDKVGRADVLGEAWAEVRANHGAPGVDGKGIEEIEREGVPSSLEGLGRELAAKSYRPSPVRRVWIPKSAGRLRGLGIPTVRDRVVQTAVKLVLEPIFEAGFEDCSYGFRPGRSAHEAVAEVDKWLNFGCERVVDADISGCFDNIPKSRLMAALAERVADGSVLHLIRQCLDAGILEGGTVTVPEAGTPQGSPLSPLLANVYLDGLDKAWKASGLTDRQKTNAHLVRYADDFVILAERNATQVLANLRRIVGELGMTLSREKTRVVEAEEGFDFLGFRFRRRYSRRRGKRATTWFPSPKSEARVRERIREETESRVLSEGDPWDAKERLERLLVGWFDYFGRSQARSVANSVLGYAHRRLACLLRTWHQWRRPPAYEVLQKVGLSLVGTRAHPRQWVRGVGRG